jgi:hypothetical protein
MRINRFFALAAIALLTMGAAGHRKRRGVLAHDSPGRRAGRARLKLGLAGSG